MATLLDRNRGRVDAAVNATIDGTDLTAGSPVMVVPERVDGSSVKWPVNYNNLPSGAVSALFAGVLTQDLAYGEQTDSALQVEGICSAKVLIPSSGTDAVVGANLAPAYASGASYFKVVARPTGVVLLEDLSANTDGSVVSGLVEIKKNAVFGAGPRQWYWEDAALGSATYYVSAQASSTGVTTVTDLSGYTKTAPDFPRNIVVTPGGTAGSIATGTVVISGYDAYGVAISESFATTADTTTAITGTQAFAKITGVVISAQDGAGATFGIGTGAKLGLGRCFEGTPPVLQARLDETVEGTAPTLAVDRDEVSKNTISFNTALNGSKDANVILFC